VKMPNADRAIVSHDKITGYCLSPNHPRGRHKARVIQAALGLTQKDMMPFKQLLLAHAQQEATLLTEDSYGQRYGIDALCQHGNQAARLRTIWIIRQGESIPQLVTCYIL